MARLNAGRVISPDAALKKVLPVAKVDMLKVSDFLTELPCVAADIFQAVHPYNIIHHSSESINCLSISSSACNSASV